jgi:hypothetical protein
MAQNTLIAFISNRTILVVGTQHTGWLPVEAASPQAEPPRAIKFSLGIRFDGFGYLLLVASEDQALYGDTWHLSEEDAEQAAEEAYGIRPEEWIRDLPGGIPLVTRTG